MAEIYDFNTTAASNNSPPPDGFPENMQYSQVNNAARELMAGIARYIQALGGVTTAGSEGAYTLMLDQQGAPAKGRHYIFTAHATNTGAATLSINGGEALAISRHDNAPVAAGAIVAGGTYLIIHNGTSYVLFGSPTGAEIKSAYEVEPMAFTDAHFTKLNGIEIGATTDQTGAEIKAAYEAEPMAFTNALFTKLNNIGKASETRSGLVERATAAEVQAGRDTTRYVTPANLNTSTPTMVIRANDRTGNGVGTNTLALGVDPELSGVALPAGTYLIEAVLPIARTFSGSIANTFGLGVEFSAGPPISSSSALSWVIVDGFGETDHDRAAPLRNDAGANATALSTANTAEIRLTGYLRMASGYTINFEWAQRGPQPVTLRTGAFIRYAREA